MSRVETVARALYDVHRYNPGDSWDTTAERGVFMMDARYALMADDPTFGTCRVCGHQMRELRPHDGSIMADFGFVPLANDYRTDAPRFPLRYEYCSDCVLLQIEEAVDPDVMFKDYAYRSGQSSTWLDSVRELVAKQTIPPNGLAVEVGSNDGVLLAQYPHTVRVLGVDPSGVEAPVQTLAEYFTARLAWDLVGRHGKAHVIHANNVIAHCSDPHDLFDGFATLLHHDGKLIVETPSLEHVVYAWDTLYHEHVFSWSVTALDRLAFAHHLRITDVERLDLHGGSLRVTFQHHGVFAPLAGWKHRERGLRFTGLASRIDSDAKRLRNAVAFYQQQGKVVCGYGAAAKASLILSTTGVDLAFVCDTTPSKLGKVMPGTNIPIVTTDCLANADVAVLFAWNYADEVREREDWWRGLWLNPHEAPSC